MGSPRCTLRLEHVERAVAVTRNTVLHEASTLEDRGGAPRASVWSQRSLIWNFAQRT